MKHSLLAITMGDPAGIGPETIAKAWSDPVLHEQRQLVVVGRPEIMRDAVQLIGCNVDVVDASIESIDGDRPVCLSAPAVMPCIPAGSDEALSVQPAQIDARGGQAAYDALKLATELALNGIVDGIITAPLHKTALAAAGHDYPGHTELLAELCGVDQVAMMLYLPPGGQVQGPVGLGVVHATLHTALRNVFDELSIGKIVSCARLANDVMQRLGAGSPRIAVAALNPHAGESGLFGDEEQTLIAPAVESCRAEGQTVEGPLPCDTLMIRAAAGEFDGVVAMYHDQGHIALKLLGMHSAVNVTLGLPIIRTSVAHGTAFDLAWRGVAEHSGLLAAVEVADKLAATQANAGKSEAPSQSQAASSSSR